MQKTIEFLTKSVLGEEANFSVIEKQNEDKYDDSLLIFEIKVDEELKPKLIGRGGQTIKAIQNLANIVSRRTGNRVYISIKD